MPIRNLLALGSMLVAILPIANRAALREQKEEGKPGGLGGCGPRQRGVGATHIARAGRYAGRVRFASSAVLFFVFHPHPLLPPYSCLSAVRGLYRPSALHLNTVYDIAACHHTSPMETAVNGHLVNGFHPHTPMQNGKHHHLPSLEELERELPVVMDGQIPLGELVSRLVQAMYAELVEMAET